MYNRATAMIQLWNPLAILKQWENRLNEYKFQNMILLINDGVHEIIEEIDMMKFTFCSS